MNENSIHSKPKTGSTPQRQIRIPDELYRAACAKALREGTRIAPVICDLLEEYLARD